MGSNSWTLFGALVIVAGCAGDGLPAAADRHAVVIAAGPDEVVFQFGAYNLGDNIDQIVTAPTVVIYGDGSAHGRVLDDRTGERRYVRASFDDDLVRDLVAASADLPQEASNELCEIDEVATRLLVDGRSWDACGFLQMDEFDSFVQAVLNEWSSIEKAPWVPAAWIDRSSGCTVIDDLTGGSLEVVPLYPHLVDDLPLGPIDCFAPGL